MNEDPELTKFYKEFVGPRFSVLRMSSEERHQIMDANPPKIYEVLDANLYFNWGWKACGFGQMSVFYNKETGKWEGDVELMQKENVRKILHALVDHIMDTTPIEDLDG